jgi:hypothetical protein
LPGYNPGKGLGPSGEGRTEPVAVELKANIFLDICIFIYMLSINVVIHFFYIG